LTSDVKLVLDVKFPKNICNFMMAWTCSGRSNAELIENMAKMGLINSPRVTAAMKKVDRANYVLNKETAYDDSPQLSCE